MPFGWINRLALISLLAGGVVLLTLMLLLVAHDRGRTSVVFLSVGQGDAILIQSGQQQVLIDGGRSGATLLSALGRVMPFYDRRVEVVIATHPDADHIGGLSTLMDRYQVDQFISTGATSDTSDMQLLDQAVERRALARISGRSGVQIELANGGKLSLLYPVDWPLPPNTPSNEGSIVARFEFGGTSFLLTGDLPHEESFLPNIQSADVLKVAHHGSAYSTSEAWLDRVRPREAVISVGENNYGHPAPAVMERLARRGIVTLRTDQLGSIIYRCFSERQQCLREE